MTISTSDPALEAKAGFDVTRLRAEFPFLHRRVHGHPLAYLDNAATAQKPQVVLDALAAFYATGCANVHRGVHTLSQEATVAYDRVREEVAQALNASAPDEIVFTAGTTAGLNLVAASYGGSRLRPGDEIVVTELEHHSNLVPWHLVAERTGAKLRAIPIDETGHLNLTAAAAIIGPRTRVLAVGHASNVLGTINPIRTLADWAHAVGAVVVVDGAQSLPHLPVDVQALDCDFFAFSAHKVFGPMGVGVLYGRRELLETMPPVQGGGGMIAHVTIERSTYAPPPTRFEGGTPPVGEVLGMGAALRWLETLDRPAVLQYEEELLQYAEASLRAVPGVRVFGPSTDRVSVLSFVVDGIHPHDVGTVLDRFGVAVRVGHHCAQPLMARLGVPATARASFAPYNTRDDVDALVRGIRESQRVFGV